MLKNKFDRDLSPFCRGLTAWLLLVIKITVLANAIFSDCQGQDNGLPNPFDFFPSGEVLESKRRAEIGQDAKITQQPSANLDTASPPTDPSTANQDVGRPAASDEQMAAPEAQTAAVELQEAAAGGRPAAMGEQQVKDPAALALDLPKKPIADKFLDRKFGKALLIEVEGPIFDRFHWYLNNRLDQAERDGVDLVLIRLTSPGGDLEHSLQLARRLRDLENMTAAVFIPQEAISGGAIISLGCERIFMQRNALIGDAGPISLGLGGQFEHAPEKVVSYLASAIRELAGAHGRPAALAEAMVDRNLVVYHATELATGKKIYVTQNQVDAPGFAAQYQVGAPVPESGQNRFLTVGAERAYELGLCEGVFESQSELLRQLQLGTVEVTRMTWVDKTVFLLNRPWLTGLLLIIGLIGLYLELAAPGISVAGLTAVLCFSIFFWSHALGGTSGWLEVMLFGLGVVCIVCELFVLPGVGIFGITGLGLVVMSLVMASQDFVLPNGQDEWTQMRSNLLMVLGAVLGVMVLFFAQILLLDSIPGLNRFRLVAPSREDQSSLETGFLRAPASEKLQTEVGALGVAESDLRPAGKVMLAGGLFDVVTEGDYVEAGTKVEVLRMEGNRILVRKVDADL